MTPRHPRHERTSVIAPGGAWLDDAAIQLRTLFLRHAEHTYGVVPDVHHVTQYYHCVHGGLEVGIAGRVYHLNPGEECWSRQARSGAAGAYAVRYLTLKRILRIVISAWDLPAGMQSTLMTSCSRRCAV